MEKLGVFATYFCQLMGMEIKIQKEKAEKEVEKKREFIMKFNSEAFSKGSEKLLMLKKEMQKERPGLKVIDKNPT